ncbi:MAG TPA: adenylyltransferase/cytidyltransferase family protein [Anaerolineae bacterium]|nr:adenylyltransferase/cytidyltransferase family protein [Anaerolineae bacterium]
MDDEKNVVVTGSFDDLRSRHVRFLEEAAKLGAVHVLLWSDEIVRSLEGKKFPQEERLYLLEAIRYVRRVTVVADEAARDAIARDAIPQVDEVRPDVWVVDEASDNVRKRAYCESRGVEYRVLSEEDLKGFPVARVDAHTDQGQPARKRVIVTGCYDWFHSGHVRFFEEVSELGDLYVVVGHDANVRLLKGEGHPLFPQDERRYMVGSIRTIKQALISTGHGWIDAEPEIARIKPDIYAVNEDGDKPEKREFCKAHGIQYVVLERVPKEGLPRRESTVLRGF